MSLLKSLNAGQTGQNDCVRPNSLPSLVLYNLRARIFCVGCGHRPRSLISAGLQQFVCHRRHGPDRIQWRMVVVFMSANGTGTSGL